MRAKEFLQQLEKLDALIENKLAEIEQWKSIATDTTAKMEGERVQSSGSQQRMADAVIRYISVEEEYLGIIADLKAARKEIISVIEKLNATEYDILHKLYVQRLDLYEVAAKKNKSYSWVTTMHGIALKNVQKILDAAEYNRK